MNSFKSRQIVIDLLNCVKSLIIFTTLVSGFTTINFSSSFDMKESRKSFLTEKSIGEKNNL